MPALCFRRSLEPGNDSTRYTPHTKSSSSSPGRNRGAFCHGGVAKETAVYISPRSLFNLRIEPSGNDARRRECTVNFFTGNGRIECVLNVILNWIARFRDCTESTWRDRIIFIKGENVIRGATFVWTSTFSPDKSAILDKTWGKFTHSAIDEYFSVRGY